MDFDEELINEFVAESNEHLESIEDDFLALEKQGDSPDEELVGKIFRAIHSIKGAAGFLGLNRINELSHVMENLLDMIRNGEIHPNSEIVDALLSGVDLLKNMVGNIANSDTYETENVVRQISGFVASEVSPEVKKSVETQVGLQDEEGRNTGFEISRFNIDHLPDKNLYVLSYDLTRLNHSMGMTPVALVNELLSVGEIIDAHLETLAVDLSEAFEDQALAYKVLYATVMEKELLPEALSISEEEFIQVDKDAVAAGAQESAPEQAASDAPSEKKKPEPPSTSDPKQEKPEAQEKKKKQHKTSGTIRLNVEILDRLMNLASELVLVRNQQLASLEHYDQSTRNMVQRLDIVTGELQEAVMKTRLQEVGKVFSKLPRIVRDLSKKLSKTIQIKIKGGDVEVDKTILESLTDPFTHIIRNSCDHGIEPPEERKRKGKPPEGIIRVNAFHEGGQINILIEDDGKGLDAGVIKEKALARGMKTEHELETMNEKEIFALVAQPGFSTAETVSNVSGRGVGMDVVKKSVEKLGGSLEIRSAKDAGTTIQIKLPLTLAIIPCLIVSVDDTRYAIPQINLEELVTLYDYEIRDKIEIINEQEVYRLRNTILPMVHLSDVLQCSAPFTEQTRSEYSKKHQEELNGLEDLKGRSISFAVVKVGNHRFGLIVDQVLGTEEIVVKPMHQALKKLKIYSGATVLGDGKAALILDIDGIADHTNLIFGDQHVDDEDGAEIESVDDQQNVLIFKSGLDEQFGLFLPLIRRIEKFRINRIEKVGSQEYVSIDEVPTLVVRLDRLFSVSPVEESEEMFLLLPKHARKPFGILISSIVDISKAPRTIDTETFQEPGIMGSSIIDEHIVLFLDTYEILHKTDPNWSREQQDDRSIGAGKRVLIVEDTKFFKEMMRKYLEERSFEVVTAENGEAGLEKLRGERFDLIVSDINMPVMDGLAFAKNVRSLESFRTIPMLALTSLSEEKDQELCREAGFDEYELKLDKGELFRKIKTLLQHN